MVSEVRIYVEGGGDGRDSKAQLREGFSQFLSDWRTIARSKRIRWRIIPCGPRGAAYRNFKNALQDHPDAFNILLVDSEGPVSSAPWQHLSSRDNWQALGTDERCHLMVQMMEAWLVADVDALGKFYGQDFNANPIPKNPNVEEITKQSLEPALKAATKNTTKGEYHKIRHGPRILAQLDVAKVRKAAAHCNRLFTTLADKLGTTYPLNNSG